MARITSTVGLVSGINTSDIIDQLMTIESRSKTRLQTRIDTTNQQRLAYVDLSTRISTLKLTATTLKKPSTFQASSAVSGNDDVLTATASNNASVGTYQFQVARLVSTQQSVSKGFVDYDSARVGAGTLTIEMGGGELSNQPLLSTLNGGAGVRRGLFRITDRSGGSAIIDATAAVSLDDIVKKINTNLDINVRASIGREGLVLEDLTGSTAGNFVVQDVGDGKTAADLKLVANVASARIDGGDINYLSENTVLGQLNDGRGLRLGTEGNDLAITAGGQTINVSLTTARTLGDVLNLINTAGGGAVQASIAPGANGITLTGATAVASVGNSRAAEDLGLTVAASGGGITGAAIIGSLGSVLVSSLNGGAGFNFGSFTITDRAGHSDTIDLAGVTTVTDILDRINAGPNTLIHATLNSAGNGIALVDESGGTGNLVIADMDDQTPTASALGIAGTFDLTRTSVQGANLQRQWISANTLLSSFNGGKGVAAGSFKITNSAGVSAQVDLSQGNEVTLQDVIAEINSRQIGVTATINAKGDGLLLTDTSGGAGHLTVAEVDGTTAADLNILGTAMADTIDGSWEKTITLDANDTLSTVQQKINALGFGVTASIVNDGSGLSPYRLSLSSHNSGRAGRVTFDAGVTGLTMNKLVEAQDAAVFLGSADAEQPLLITAGKNQLNNVIRGVNIELHGVSNQPVTLSVGRDIEPVVKQLTGMVENFNSLIDKIKELTKYDSDTKTRGLLLGEGTIGQIENDLYYTLSTVVAGGRYRMLADVGIKLADGAKLEFDEEKFRAAYAENPDAVSRLFTLADTGIGAVMETRLNRLIDPENGIIPRHNQSLDTRTAQFQTRMDNMDKILTAKRERLERQFAQMESILSNLQYQQTSLNQLANINFTSSSKSS